MPDPTKGPKETHMATEGKLERQRVFLETLAKTGRVDWSAEAAGVSRTHVYSWRSKKQDPDGSFREQWKKAETEAVTILEDEATRRAVEGWEEPVYYKGEVCGTIRKFSDTLLMFRLNGLAPERYKRRVDVTGDIKTTTKAQEMSDAELHAIAARGAEEEDRDG